MPRTFLALTLLALVACGKQDHSMSSLSSEPVSVRGWILDVKGAQRAETFEMELARRTQLFQSTSLWVENSEYASGGIAENGSFIILDVPPVNATIGVNAPGAETAKIILQNVPGTADVFIPDVILENGGATVLDPTKILVRLPGNVDKPTRTDKTAIVAGHAGPVIETPLGQMMDRRDYPQVPGFRPVATVR